MSVADLFNVAFGIMGVLAMIGAAFMWVGVQKQQMANMADRQREFERSMEIQVKGLEAKLAAHDEMKVAFAEMRAELSAIKTSIAAQPQAIAVVVAESMKAAIQAIRDANARRAA